MKANLKEEKIENPQRLVYNGKTTGKKRMQIDETNAPA